LRILKLLRKDIFETIFYRKTLLCGVNYSQYFGSHSVIASRALHQQKSFIKRFILRRYGTITVHKEKKIVPLVGMRFSVIVTSKDIFFWVIMRPSSLGGNYFMMKKGGNRSLWEFSNEMQKSRSP